MDGLNVAGARYTSCASRTVHGLNPLRYDDNERGPNQDTDPEEGNDAELTLGKAKGEREVAREKGAVNVSRQVPEVGEYSRSRFQTYATPMTALKASSINRPSPMVTCGCGDCCEPAYVATRGRAKTEKGLKRSI